MTAFDYVVLAIVGLSLLAGLIRGATREVLALAAWVIAFTAANIFAGDVAPLLADRIPNEWLRFITAFAGLFVGVMLIMALVRVALSGVIRKIGLGGIDRVLGLGFGLVRGVVVVLLLVLFAGMTRLPEQPEWEYAVSSPWFEAVIAHAKPWLPEELARRIHFARIEV